MAFPSVTYTFANSTTADATQVNQNFTDLINGLSDTTKNISISALTAAGATNLQGAVTLGASSGNDLTINGSLASSIAIKTTQSYDIGAATLALRSIYLGSADAAARSTRVIGGTVASSWTMTLPTSGGTAGYSFQTDGSGTTSWVATPPTGSIIMYGAASAPSGYLLCDGSAVSRTTYATLFAVISTTFGIGDGSSTFNVPDMRGVFPKGAGTTNRSAGKDASANFYAGTLGAYSTDQMQGHIHTVAAVAKNGAFHTTGFTAGTDTQIGTGDNTASTINSAAQSTDGINGGTRSGHTTEPQSLGLTYIIKT